MKRYLGVFSADDIESRTIDTQNPDRTDPKVDVVPSSGNKNFTREGTPNVVSDMSKSLIASLILSCYFYLPVFVLFDFQLKQLTLYHTVPRFNYRDG